MSTRIPTRGPLRVRRPDPTGDAAPVPASRNANVVLSLLGNPSPAQARRRRTRCTRDQRKGTRIVEDQRCILVVDDQPAVREGLQRTLSEMGHIVVLAEDAESGLRQTIAASPDLVIIDLNLPGRSGLELVADLQDRGEDATLIVLTGHGSIETAIEATRRGVFDYLLKPIEPAMLRRVVERGLERASLRREVMELRRETMRTGRLQALVGRSPAMLELYRLLEQIGPSGATVLVAGESGTGKELVARTLHHLSPRATRAFVAINCAAIPETLLESEILGHERGAFTGATTARAGCFEQAAGGTLFLDEIAEMPAELQSKLLRVLEDRRVRRVGGEREFEVDVRVIAATNAELEQILTQGKLRSDLYFRLNVFTLRIPPLRERTQDIPMLAEHFLETFREEARAPIAGFSAAAQDLLLRHAWPGNVRELRNVVQRAVILCPGGEISPEHLPATLLPPRAGIATDDPSRIVVEVGSTMAEAEKALLLATLKACSGDKPKTARLLNISLKTLYNRLAAYAKEAKGTATDVPPPADPAAGTSSAQPSA